MKIANVIYSVGRAGFFNEDLTSIKKGAQPNGLVYSDPPETSGFRTIVQPSQSISVMLILDDGLVGFGDCTDVIFSGQAGRDPLFQPNQHLEYLEREMRGHLIGQSVSEFRPLAEKVDKIERDGKPLHAALRYGVTQAILHATSLCNRKTITEVVADEYGAEIVDKPIQILANCEPFDHLSIDKAIVKRAELLPHGAFPNAKRDLGIKGKVLIEYTLKLVARIQEIGGNDYHPVIHYDLYGSIAELFENEVEKIVEYFAALEIAARPYDLYVESPAVMENRAEQIKMFSELRRLIVEKGLGVKLIVDEWCNTKEDVEMFTDARATDFVQIKTPDLGGINNTIEALLYARNNGVGACLGGSANETDQSTRITTQIGLACGPNFMLAKPGFGCDEAMMILTNEMSRTLALIRGKIEYRLD